MRRRKYDPKDNYNLGPPGVTPIANLGATQTRGQVLAHQSRRKVESDIPQEAIQDLIDDLASKQESSDRGIPNGYAPLDSSGQVPLTNLPLPLTQTNSHASPDTDAGAGSLHHTLGTGANQAAAGDHTHTLILSLPAFYVSGVMATGPGVLRLPVVDSYTIVGVRLTLDTAPVGSDFIADINKNGTTIFSTAGNRPRIVDGANAGGPGATPNVTSLAAGDYLTLDIDQIGSGTPGSDLTVTVVVTKAI